MSNSSTTNFKSSLLVPVSGGLSGIIEACSTHPLDRIKTEVQRQMLESKSTKLVANPRSPLFNSVLNIYNSGGATNFYKGIVPRLFGILPMRVAFWGALETGNKIVADEERKMVKFLFPGIFAGSIQTLIDNPIEVLKIRLMTSNNPTAAPVQAASVPATSSTLIGTNTASLSATASYSTAANAGMINHPSIASQVKNLYKGFFPCLYRNIIFTVTLSSVTRTFKDYNAFVIGAIGGLLGSVISHPFDVVKTEMQRIQSTKVNPSMPPFSSNQTNALAKKSSSLIQFQTFTILKNIFMSNPKQIFSGLSMRCLLSFMNMGIGFYCLNTIQEGLKPFFE